MKVVKFGGSSLSDGVHFRKVVNIIKTDSQRKVIVTSAPGKRNPHDDKVTDLLDAAYLMAAFKAHGEKLNAYLMAKILNSQGIKAKYMDPDDAGILVSDNPNNASVL